MSDGYNADYEEGWLRGYCTALPADRQRGISYYIGFEDGLVAWVDDLIQNSEDY